MAYAVFDFEGNKIKIQCNIEDTIQKILTNFASKIKIELDSLLFLYGGNLIEIYNNELTYEELANQFDLENRRTPCPLTSTPFNIMRPTAWDLPTIRTTSGGWKKRGSLSFRRSAGISRSWRIWGSFLLS